MSPSFPLIRETKAKYTRAMAHHRYEIAPRPAARGGVFPAGAYVQELQRTLSAPSVKQHLAAIRMLFEHFVLGQVLPTNPAASVRGPKYVAAKGKTPVLTGEEVRALLNSISGGPQGPARPCPDRDARLYFCAPNVVRR